MTIFPPASSANSGGTELKGKVWPWFAGAIGLVLSLGNPVPIIGHSLVRLTYVLNPGIAFGVDIFGLRPLLVFGWLAAIMLSIYLARLARHRDLLRWPVMLFLAGAVGNSIDRLIFGQVTDFVDVDMPDFIMERFAVFNVADSCITVGIVLLAAIVLFVQRKSDEIPASASGGPHDSGEQDSNTEFDTHTPNPASPVPPDHSAGSAARSD
jgi:signal peptidase II